jgi:putative ABC transport system permease protein
MVIGSEVAQRLGYTLGTPVVVVHGLRDIGTSSHEAHPFRVVGVLERTFTPIDRSIYVTLEGIEAMHEEEDEPVVAAPPPAMPGAEAPPTMPGAAPPPGTPMAMPGAEPPPAMPGAVAPRSAAPARTASAESEEKHDAVITGFLVGTKNRFEALMLQREMNTDLTEPLTAVIPGVALSDLWQNIGSAEVGLRVVAAFAVAIGLTGMLVALYSSLDARRREMAILRSVGAGPRTIVSLLVLESGLLALLGCIIGVGLVYLGLAIAQGPVEARFGLHLAIRPLGATEWGYLATVLGAGVLIGFVPAIKAYRSSLADGLSPRS